MAFRGQVLVNSFSGERFVFHTTAAESGGELLEFDAVVEPHGRVPGGHVHPGQQESFEVRAGVMKFRKGLRTVTAGPGDLVVVEPGTYHRFANAGDEPAIVRVRLTPALRMEELFETVAALAAEGRTLRSGMPRPLDLALFMREFEHEVAAPVAPALVRTVMTPLAAIGERRGLAARYRHSRPLPAGRYPRAPSRPGPARAGHPPPGHPPRARRRPGPAGRGRPPSGGRSAGAGETQATAAKP
jgi:quercetin dioxygenase-like cupin family protein